MKSWKFKGWGKKGGRDKCYSTEGRNNANNRFLVCSSIWMNSCQKLVPKFQDWTTKGHLASWHEMCMQFHALSSQGIFVVVLFS